MLWLGIILLVVIAIGLSIFFYCYSAINKESARKNKEFIALVEFARTEKDFEKFVARAAETRFTEIVFYRKDQTESQHPLVKSPSITPLGVSARNAEAIRQIILEMKSGRAVFSDPADTPLMYSRPFLRVDFDNGAIVKIEDDNLG